MFSCLQILEAFLWFVLITLLNVTLRSEERFSRNAETDLVCRLLLEKKKNDNTASQMTILSRQHREEAAQMSREGGIGMAVNEHLRRRLHYIHILGIVQTKGGVESTT